MTKRMIASGRIIAGVKITPLIPGSQAYLASGKRVEVVKVRGRDVRVKFFDVRDGWRKWWVDRSELSPR